MRATTDLFLVRKRVCEQRAKAYLALAAPVTLSRGDGGGGGVHRSAGEVLRWRFAVRVVFAAREEVRGDGEASGENRFVPEIQKVTREQKSS